MLGLLTFLCFLIAIHAQAIQLRSKYQAGDLKLVYAKQAADILISIDDFKVVAIAANDLAADVALVANIKPTVKTTRDKLSKDIVIVGTLGKNSLIDDLVRAWQDRYFQDQEQMGELSDRNSSEAVTRS